MRRKQIQCSIVIALWMLVTTISVHSEAGKLPPVTNTSADSVPPITSKDELLNWLKAEKYKAEFVAEPEVHPSSGPHGGNVRTYFNSILTEDLRAGKTKFRKNAAMVKELYFSGTETVVGYAVMVKVKKKSKQNGKEWLYYETFDGTNNSVFYGRGVRLCVDCHRAGTDYLLSPFRP